MAASDPRRAFLGVGWAFPVRLDLRNHTARAAYEEDVYQSVKIILDTNPGERVMRPEFGAGLKAFMFEPVSQATITQLRNRVFNALVDFEPRIIVERVIGTYDRSEPGRVNLEIFYRVRATNTQFNLVYPFYLQEGTPR